MITESLKFVGGPLEGEKREVPINAWEYVFMKEEPCVLALSEPASPNDLAPSFIYRKVRTKEGNVMMSNALFQIHLSNRH